MADNKLTDTVNNICTLLGGALLLYPLIDEAAKTIIPEMQKLTSGETEEKIKALPFDDKKPKEEPEHDNELAELKRKLAKYESALDEHKSDD